MNKFRLAVITTALLLSSIVAQAAGLFPDFPTVGEASRCAGTSTGANGSQVCTATVPAGPTAVTGDDRLVADTHLANGSQPQTALIPLRAIGAAPLQYNLCASATCGTVTVGDSAGGILFDYSTTITSATVNLPVHPMDGQQVTIASAYTISTLAVVAGAGTTLAVTTPTVLTASTTVPQGYKFQYVLSTTKWYRIY